MMSASRIAAPYPDRVGFILGTMLVLLFFVGVILLVGHFYPGSGADLLDWKPTRSYETEVQLEIDDVQQMLDAQNEMRRRKGKPDLTNADAERMAREDEAVRERARRGRAEKLAEQLEDEAGT
jgi:hypothetical protein